MTDKFITEINRLLIRFIRKLLFHVLYEPERTKEAEDLTHNAWIKVLSKYPDKTFEDWEVRPLLFHVARNEALQFLRRHKIGVAVYAEYAHTTQPAKGQNNIFELLAQRDMQVFLKKLHPVQAYIWEKCMELEPLHTQEKIVEMIQAEFKQKFGKDLSLANLRTLKKRAALELWRLLSKDWM